MWYLCGMLYIACGMWYYVLAKYFKTAAALWGGFHQLYGTIVTSCIEWTNDNCLSCTELLLINGGKDEDDDEHLDLSQGDLDLSQDEDDDDHLDLSQGDRHGNKAEPEVRQGEVEDEQISEQ